MHALYEGYYKFLAFASSFEATIKPELIMADDTTNAGQIKTLPGCLQRADETATK